MRTHTKTFHIRFTEKEYQRLCEHSKKAGLPKSTYIRHMINGCSPQEYPAEMFRDFMEEIRRVGNNLNQLTKLTPCWQSSRGQTGWSSRRASSHLYSHTQGSGAARVCEYSRYFGAWAAVSRRRTDERR